MKKIAILSLSIILFACCAKQKSTGNSSEMEIYPRAEMKAILDSFVVSCNDKSLIYELYIDEIRNRDYDIVLYAGKRSLIDNGHPIMKTTISGITVHVYSGIEHYFESNSSQVNNPKVNDSLPDERPEGNYWLIADKEGQIIKEEAFGYPFRSSFRVEFVAPEEIKDEPDN
jgi:hypothetical protein